MSFERAAAIDRQTAVRVARDLLLARSEGARALALARSVPGANAAALFPRRFDGALAARLPRAAPPAPPALRDSEQALPEDDPIQEPLGTPKPPASRAAPPAARTPASDEPAEPSAAAEQRYRVQPGDTLWALAVHRFHTNVSDLARDNGIADPSRIEAGQVLVVNRRTDATPRRVVASWYGPGFDARPMANGDPYDRHAATIAHKTLPLGTEVELTNRRTGVTVRATVTDRGPYVDGRDVDLSYGLARELDVVEPGVAELWMRVRG